MTIVNGSQVVSVSFTIHRHPIFYNMYSFCKHGIRNLPHRRLFAHIVELTPMSYLVHGCLISYSQKVIYHWYSYYGYNCVPATLHTFVLALLFRVRHHYTGSGGSLILLCKHPVTWCYFAVSISSVVKQSQVVSWLSCHMHEKPLLNFLKVLVVLLMGKRSLQWGTF